MNLVDIVAVLAVIQYLVTGYQVGRARGRYQVKAPATTGHPQFERIYRVQMNTLELLVAFLPGLLIAGRYWPSAWVASIGAVYLVGRVVYAIAYQRDPARRALGFLLSLLPVVVLLALAFAGAVQAR